MPEKHILSECSLHNNLRNSSTPIPAPLMMLRKVPLSQFFMVGNHYLSKRIASTQNQVPSMLPPLVDPNLIKYFGAKSLPEILGNLLIQLLATPQSVLRELEVHPPQEEQCILQLPL